LKYAAVSEWMAGKLLSPTPEPVTFHFNTSYWLCVYGNFTFCQIIIMIERQLKLT